MKSQSLSFLTVILAAWFFGVGPAQAATLFVDDTFLVTNDIGWADVSTGDTVTFSPGQPNQVPGLIVGTNAFADIASAVAAATSGDTIQVAAGNYVLSDLINIDKPLTILGAQASVDPRPSASSTRSAGSVNESTIDGNAQLFIFYINASDVMIDGFTLRDSTNPVFAQDGPLSRIKVSHSFIQGGMTGIELDAVHEALVEYNDVSGATDRGILFGGNSSGSSVGGIIRHNEVHDMGLGGGTYGIHIHAQGSGDIEVGISVERNLIRDANIDGVCIGISNGSDLGADVGTVTENVIRDLQSAGVVIWPSISTVSRNEIYRCASGLAPIEVYARNEFLITENDLHDNPNGSAAVWVEYYGGLTAAGALKITRNRFADNHRNKIIYLDHSGGPYYLNASLNSFGADDQNSASDVPGTVSHPFIDGTPWLASDEDSAPLTPGFQPDLSVLNVFPVSHNSVTSGVHSIKEALDSVSIGGTVRLHPGFSRYLDSSVNLPVGVTLDVLEVNFNPTTFTFSNSNKLTGSGWLDGTFSIGNLTLSPGNHDNAVGALIFQNGTVTLNSNVTYEVDLRGPVAGVSYDQIMVSAPLNLGGATLVPTLGYTPNVGDTFTVARGLGAISGAFADLPNGHRFKLGATTLEVTYTSIDAILTVVLPDLTMFDTDSSVELFATHGIAPASGVFTGLGITGSTFDPATAGPGHHTITFTQNGTQNVFTFTVTVYLPSPAVVTHPADDGSVGSLRWALSVVEPGGTVEFSDNTDHGATDFHDGGPHTITFNGSQISLDRDVTIAGPGADLLILEANYANRHFQVTNNAMVDMAGLTFRHGFQYSQGGGAITSSQATLRLTDCVFSGNYAAESDGGALFCHQTDLTLVRCHFLDNWTDTYSTSVPTSGGAVSTQFASLTVEDCVFLRNHADGVNYHSTSRGGAVFTHNAPATFTRSTFAGNSSLNGSGGAVSLGSGSTTFLQCTFTENSAPANYAPFNGFGGAIVGGGTVHLLHCTVARNQAASGGGLYPNGAWNLQNSIVATNTSNPGYPGPDIYGNFNSLGYNLIGAIDNSSGFGPLDLVGIAAQPRDPKLATGLTELEGIAPTLLPLLGSPVINGGDPAFDPDAYTPALAKDQRGSKRVAGGRIDIGAVELGTYTPQVTAASTLEDTQTTAGLVITPNPLDNGETTHFLVGAVQGGTLYLADGVTVPDSQLITVAQGAAGLKFTPAANRNSENSSFIGFFVVATSGSNFPDDVLGNLDDESIIAEVLISVTPVNDPPTVTVSDPDPIPYNSGLQTIALTGISGGPLESAFTHIEISTDTPALLTNLTLNHTPNFPTGSITFQPAHRASGTATITITLDDRESTNNVTTRTLTVVIENYTPPPVAYTNGKAPITIDVVGNAGLVPGGTLTITGQGQFGKATIVSGRVKYTPTGILPRGGDTFTYRYDDGHGVITTETVTITNFATLAGTYDGLITSPYIGPGLERHIRNGYLRLTVGQGGTFSGSITFAGEQLGYVERAGFRGYVFNGKLGAGATDLRVIARPPQGNVTLTLQFDPVANLITGTAVSLDNDGHGFTSEIELHPQAPAGQAAGRYTLLIQPDSTPNSPPGAGYATTVIDAKGAVRVVGKLPDGSTFTSSAGFRADQSFPIYSALYSGKFAQRGSIRGLIQFPSSPLPAGDASGDLEWFKPVRRTDVYHPNGFDLTRTAILGRYTKPVGNTPVLAFAPGQLNGLLLREGGGLASSDQALTLLTGTRFVLAVPNPSKASLIIDPATGLFRGSFEAPNKKRYPYNGALLQGAVGGGGFFLNPDTKQTGAVAIEED